MDDMSCADSPLATRSNASRITGVSTCDGREALDEDEAPDVRLLELLPLPRLLWESRRDIMLLKRSLMFLCVGAGVTATCGWFMRVFFKLCGSGHLLEIAMLSKGTATNLLFTA